MSKENDQKNTLGFTLAELAELTRSKLSGNPDFRITGVADLESASESEISFLGNLRYQQAMLKSQAGVVIVNTEALIDSNRNFLISDNPSRAFQAVIEAFHKDSQTDVTGFTGIHPTAVIHPTVKLGKNVSVGPYTVIDKDAVVGDDTVISAGCYIGLGVTMGCSCLIYPHVVIRERSWLGNRVILQSGAIIGSCGFGYIFENGHHVKLSQLGSVRLEDDVEIGANTTVDRARFKETLVKKGTKIDNLVQIAHGVVLGEHNIIVAQTGIAGSSETGKGVVVGGQVAIDGHLKLDDGVRLAARSGVSKSLPTGTYSGAPVQPINEFNRNTVLFRNLEKYVKQLKDLLIRVTQLEKNLHKS